MIEEFARKFGIDVKLLKAVIAVEAGGNGFNPDGSIKLRLEAHLVLDAYPHLSRWFRVGNPRWTNQLFRFPSQSTKWRQIHSGNPEDEYTALLTAAFQIGHEAFQFCSFGAWQIMGFHYQKLGYPSAIAMYTDMSRSKDADLAVGLKFIELDQGLIEALRTWNLAVFAQKYNGNNVAYYVQRFNQELVRL